MTSMRALLIISISLSLRFSRLDRPVLKLLREAKEAARQGRSDAPFRRIHSWRCLRRGLPPSPSRRRHDLDCFARFDVGLGAAGQDFDAPVVAAGGGAA